MTLAINPKTGHPIMGALNSFIWTPPTTNVDGTALAPGEVAGFQVGIRQVNALNLDNSAGAATAGSVAGVYPIEAATTDPSGTTESLAAFNHMLLPGVYAASIQALGGPLNSAWAVPEFVFDILPPPPVAPKPPTGFTGV